MANLLRHVVLLGFKAETTPEKIREIEVGFCDLPNKIEEIHSFEWGTNVSVENLAQEYTHCFLVTFQSEARRDTYLPHPAHQAFIKVVEPHLKQVLVVDYWAE